MKLQTTKEIAQRLRLFDSKGEPSPNSAKRLMKRLEVKPFPLGVGCGLGDRWDWEEVEEAIRSLRKPEPKEEPRKSRRIHKGYFDGSYRPRGSHS